MSGNDRDSGWDAPLLDWYLETTRKAAEQSLAAQQRAIDEWASAVEGRTEAQAEVATPVRGLAWFADVWLGAVQNALVHVDDAFEGGSVDLEELQTTWLHALDDAITDVGKTPEFAETATGTVERALTARYRGDELRRRALEGVGLPTDRDVEEVGARLLELEYRQKAVEDRLDDVLAAVGESRAPGRTARSESTGSGEAR